MLDGGALPAWFSRTSAGLREAGWLARDRDRRARPSAATSRRSRCTRGLLAARHVLGADLVVVAQGPGNLGTGTRWGFSGVACGEAVNAAAVLGGRPVASLRISEADPRERHRGISHHSLTSYGRVALARADVVRARPAGEFGARVAARPRRWRAGTTWSRVSVDGLAEVLRACPVRLSSMGRGPGRGPGLLPGRGRGRAARPAAALAGGRAARQARAAEHYGARRRPNPVPGPDRRLLMRLASFIRDAARPCHRGRVHPNAGLGKLSADEQTAAGAAPHGGRRVPVPWPR